MWSSADPLIATVESGTQGRGRVTGVNSGYVEIRAAVPSYENAAPAILSLRIANPLEIDSISPDTVRYGDRVTIYGIGVGELFFVGLGSGFLISDSLSIAGDKSGLGRQSFWVPWPFAHREHLCRRLGPAHLRDRHDDRRPLGPVRA